MSLVDCAMLNVEMSEKSKKMRKTYFIAPRKKKSMSGPV